MSNIVGNYFRLRTVTESRALHSAPAHASTRPVDGVETRPERGDPPRGGHVRPMPRHGSCRPGVCHERCHGCRDRTARYDAALDGHRAVRDRRGESGVDRWGGHRGARPAPAGDLRGGLTGPHVSGCCGPGDGRFGLPVRRCVRFRAERRRGAHRQRDHATRREPGRCPAAVLVLPTVPARGGSCARTSRTPRACRHGRRALRRDDGRVGPGRSRRHHDRRRRTRARRAARRQGRRAGHPRAR